MGDRYWLKLKCVYCGEENEIYYAESCGFDDFKCEFCGEINGIRQHFEAVVPSKGINKLQKNDETENDN